MNANVDTGFFAGLLNYEVVLLAFGVLVFLVGLWAVIRGVRTNSMSSSATGFACVVVSLFFVGYPSLKSFSVKNEFGEIAGEFANGQSPTLNEAQRQQTVAKIEALAPRASTPEQQAILANAYRGIGDIDKAFALAEKADANAPAAVRKALAPVFAAKLKQAVQDTPAIGGTVADPAKVAQIDTLVKKLDVPAAELPAQTRVAIAEGYAVLGKDAKAAANLDQAQAIQRDVRVNPRLLQRLNRAQPPSS